PSWRDRHRRQRSVGRAAPLTHLRPSHRSRAPRGPRMGMLTKWMDAKFYPSTPTNWDDELFRNVILENLRPTDHLLDFGAGAGRVSQMNFRGHAARICGVDPDERVVTNPHLDEGRVGYGEKLPYADHTFDVV